MVIHSNGGLKDIPWKMYTKPAGKNIEKGPKKNKKTHLEMNILENREKTAGLVTEVSASNFIQMPSGKVQLLEDLGQHSFGWDFMANW